MAINRWWDGDTDERFWMETTGRTDLGANLLAPQLDERDSENPGYVLVTEVDDGDIVFHYDRNREAIVAWSMAVGGFWPDELYWAAIAGGGEPYLRPAWVHGLEGPYPIEPVISRTELQSVGQHIGAVRDKLAGDVKGSLYFPFIRYGAGRWSNLRASQTYMSKVPAAVIDAVPSLRKVVDQIPPDADGTSGPRESNEDSIDIGLEYEEVDEDFTFSPADPMQIDPAIVERGNRGHASTQNALSRVVRSLGLSPRRSAPLEPMYDLAWVTRSALLVAEVKSLTDANEERQLRLGLGQVLRYQHLLRGPLPVRAVLAVEREPSDPTWSALCKELGVILVWPESMSRLLSAE